MRATEVNVTRVGTFNDDNFNSHNETGRNQVNTESYISEIEIWADMVLEVGTIITCRSI